MNQLSTAERCQIIGALVEGNSINSIVRMTGRSNNTILKLLADIGTACQKYHDEHVRGLTCKRIQCDEIWNYCYSKEKNVPEDKRGQFGYGDTWTWCAIDADTKLMVSWLVGLRDLSYARPFMQDVADRLIHRVQITTDGLRSYLDAVYNAFGNDIDYAMLVKIYGPDRSTATRYSPPQLTAIKTDVHCGNPDERYISTSFVERQNLTMRMQMRRFTRLTNGFSKKVENMKHTVALHFMHYNFCRIHKSIRVTPAMEAKLTDHVWGLEELVALL
ncbi:MAG TPA: IS1 family transposase [Tepidisphaeraceae bacterium]|jgi:IS1 family transposase